MELANATTRLDRPAGMDLRLRRVEAGVSQSALARHLGVSRQRVGNLERMYRPGRTAADRYVVALVELADQ